MVSSVGGRFVGELHMELPSRAHKITAPLRGSELESLQRLWVTEKNEISLTPPYLTSSPPPVRNAHCYVSESLRARKRDPYRDEFLRHSAVGGRGAVCFRREPSTGASASLGA